MRKRPILSPGMISILMPYEKSEFFTVETVLYAAHEAEVRNEENVRVTIDDRSNIGRKSDSTELL